MSDTQKNSIRVYLPPLYKRLTKAHSIYSGDSQSEIAAKALKQMYDQMSFQERQEILKKGEQKS